MTRKITITEILDDLRAADEITRRFERHYWLSSEDFYDLYQQGLLDDGEHTDEFSEWPGLLPDQSGPGSRTAQTFKRTRPPTQGKTKIGSDPD